VASTATKGRSSTQCDKRSYQAVMLEPSIS
jgi:hypothetical protein